MSTGKTESDRSEWIGASTFTVILTDDRGKEWHGESLSEWILALGDKFRGAANV